MDRTLSRPGPLRGNRQAESAAPSYGFGRSFAGACPEKANCKSVQGPFETHEDMDGMADMSGMDGMSGMAGMSGMDGMADRTGPVIGPGSWSGSDCRAASSASGNVDGAKGRQTASGPGTQKPYCGVNEEEYRREALTGKEREWFLSLACVDIADDLDSSIEALFRAPKSLRHSADYGFLGGLVVGRLLALDHFGKPHVKELLQKIYNLVEPWTVFNPGAAGFMLATFSPQVVYALILFWPEEYAPYRTFYTAALMGLYLEHMPGTDFLHGEGADNLCAIIESQRREGSVGLL